MLKKFMLGRIGYKVVAGIGLLSMTREKAEAGVNELIERGEVDPKDAKDIVNRLVQRGEEEKQAIRDIAHNEIKQVLQASSFATKEDLEALTQKIDILIEKINSG